MAERTITVCDTCGEPSKQTVSFKVGTRTLLKDFCAKHLSDLIANARRPKRGRKPGSKKAAAAKASAKTTGRKRSTAKRRTRRASRAAVSAAAESSSA